MERRLYEAIKYTFSASEIQELGEQLAREAQAIIELRERKAATLAAFAAQIKAADKRVADFSNRITAGYELRETECLLLMETPRPGMKRIIRIDTNETIREEAMTVQEMQGNFGFAEGEQ